MDSELATIIIYDDDEIRVIWAPRGSEFVLITFGDLIALASDHRFFADTPLDKLNISAIGIMAKRGNWYPPENFHKALPCILDRIGGYETRITYGGSMGGYAAIKFSRLLGATHVIALCPQWSIDPAECQGTDPGWGGYLLPTMSGMGIREQDVAGRVFILSDAFFPLDRFHCRMIAENHPTAHFINVPIVEHHVTTVVAGTANLQELLAACLAGDLVALHRISRHARRSHALWQRGWLQHTLRKLPRLGVAFLVNTDQHDFLKGNRDYFPLILSHIVNMAGMGQATAFYERYWPLLPAPAEQHRICAYLAGFAGRRAAIATAHMSYLVYDLTKNRVIHKAAPLDPWEAPVEIELLGPFAHLAVRIGESQFRLARAETGYIGCLAGRGEEHCLFEIKPAEDGLFTIGCDGKYLSAEASGTAICNRDNILHWERFRFGPMS